MQAITYSSASQQFDWTKLNDDLCKEIYNYPSPATLYALSCTSNSENARFYKFASLSEQVKIYLERKSNDQQIEFNSTFFLFRPFLKPVFISTAEIVAEFPACRQGRFKALGNNGRNYVKTTYGVKNDFALQRIRDGKETFESANQRLSEKQKEIEAYLKDPLITKEEQNKIQRILDKKPVLQYVLEGVITISEAMLLNNTQVKLIIDMHIDGDIAVYDLTKGQVRHLILSNFSPLGDPITKWLLGDNILGITQALELNETDLFTISGPRLSGGCSYKKTPIGNALWLYREFLTPDQALKAIKKTQHHEDFPGGLNPLSFDDRSFNGNWLATNICKHGLLTIDDFLDLTLDQLKWLNENYYLVMDSAKQYGLSATDNFNIVKNSGIFYSMEVRKAIKSGFLTAQQACGMTKSHQSFLRGQQAHLPAITEKYKLSKNETSRIILNKCNPFWYGVLGWAVDDRLLTKEQALRLTKNQIERATDKSFKEAIEKYRLTGEQAVNLILNEFNPFTYLLVQEAIPEHLTVEQALEFTKAQVDASINRGGFSEGSQGTDLLHSGA